MNHIKKTQSAFISLLILALVAGCGKTDSISNADSDVAAHTAAINTKISQDYDLADIQSFEDAKRGFIARPTGQVKSAEGEVVWDFDAFNFIEGQAPSTVNPSLWRQAALNNNIGLFKVSERIYQLRGFDLANITLIEGNTGWIVVDPLTSTETAAAAMAFARQHLGNKAVSGVLFTHSHVDHFGGVLGVITPEEVASRKVPVVAPIGFMEEATSENILMGPAMGRRAMYMYGRHLERSAKGLVDNGLGKAVPMASIGILPPNLLIDKTGQEETIDGVKFVFQNVPGSEAPAELTFYLPEMKAFGGAEMVSHTMHNLYTLRGAKVRDALKWSEYIDQGITQLSATDVEVYFGQHHWPVWGHERIIDFMTRQRDVYRFTHDQTVRMINAGMTGQEIAEAIKLPKSLDDFMNVHGYYGTLKHNSKAVYQFYMGWFDANPANLDPLPPVEVGKRFVDLAGGSDGLMKAAQKSFDGGDYRWAAQMLSNLVYAEPKNAAAKALLAKTYQQLGYVAESSAWRNFYLTGAHELTNPLPTVGVAPSLLLNMLGHVPIERFLESMAANLNAPDAEGKEMVVNLTFTDLNVNYVLTLKNSVLYHHKLPAATNANATLKLTKDLFLKMVAGTTGMGKILLSDDLKIEGSKIDLAKFFSLIDKPKGVFPIVTRE